MLVKGATGCKGTKYDRNMKYFIQEIAFVNVSGLNCVQLLTGKYHKTSNISYTKSENSNHSLLVLQLTLLNPLKPGIRSRMKI